MKKRILLNQWHVDAYIQPTRKLTRKEYRTLISLMTTFLNIQASKMMSDMNGKIELVVSQ